MVVNVAKESLKINKFVGERKEIIFVEGDMIVPDAKPDILSTINTNGTVCIYRKEVLDEKVRIDGSINTFIMYLADNSQDNVRGLNTNLDFSENINVPNCREGMFSEIDVKIKSIECKVINGRKIGIKATLEMNVKIYSNEETEMINEIENKDNIQMLRESVNINSLVGIGSTKIYAKDTINIDNVDNLAEILKADISLIDQDIKISYNKVLSKSEVEIKVMYLTEENRINTATARIPAVGFIDMPDVTENNICDVNYEIRNMILKPNNVEEHSIYVEIEIEAICTVYEEKEINLIQDLYSPCENLEINKKQMTTITDKRTMLENKQIREKINIPEIENKTIIDVDVSVIINKEDKLNSKIMYEGELELKFIFSNNTDIQLNTKNVKIPFNFTVEGIENAENLNTFPNIEITSQDFVIQDGGNVNCNIDMILRVNTYKNTNLNVIDEIQTLGEIEQEDYSVIMYIVKKGDTLWTIAKKFKSTIDDIVRINGIEDENKIYEGQKIFIPRYVVKRESDSSKTPMIKYA